MLHWESSVCFEPLKGPPSPPMFFSPWTRLWTASVVPERHCSRAQRGLSAWTAERRSAESESMTDELLSLRPPSRLAFFLTACKALHSPLRFPKRDPGLTELQERSHSDPTPLFAHNFPGAPRGFGGKPPFDRNLAEISRVATRELPADAAPSEEQP